METLKDELVALEEGDNAYRWEKLMQDEARPKVKAALYRVEAVLKDVVPAPAAVISSSGNKGTTKKEAVALPKFQGAEKPGADTPFLTFPVWFRNWN